MVTRDRRKEEWGIGWFSNVKTSNYEISKYWGYHGQHDNYS